LIERQANCEGDCTINAFVLLAELFGVIFGNRDRSLFLQQFAFKPSTDKNIKPIAGLRPATLLVVGLSDNCCKTRIFVIVDYFLRIEVLAITNIKTRK
jgi:hypothetical protein